MRPMANDLPRASTNFCITGRHNGVLYNNTMECSSRLVLALCRFPDFGFSDHTFSGTARHRFTPGILVPIVGNSDRSLLHHEPLIRLAATFFTSNSHNKQANKGNNHLVPIYNIFLIPNPLLLSRALDLLIHILVLFFPQTKIYLYIPRKQLRHCGTGQSEATTISNEVLPHVGFQDQALLAFAINSVLAPDPLPSHNL